MAEKWSGFDPAQPPVGAERVPWLQDQGGGEDNVLGTWAQVFAALGVTPAQLVQAVTDLDLGSASTFTQGDGATELPTSAEVQAMIGAGLGGLGVEIQTSDAVAGDIRIRWAETYADVAAYSVALIINDLEVAWPSTSSDPWFGGASITTRPRPAGCPRDSQSRTRIPPIE